MKVISILITYYRVAGNLSEFELGEWESMDSSVQNLSEPNDGSYSFS